MIKNHLSSIFDIFNNVGFGDLNSLISSEADCLLKVSAYLKINNLGIIVDNAKNSDNVDVMSDAYLGLQFHGSVSHCSIFIKSKDILSECSNYSPILFLACLSNKDNKTLPACNELRGRRLNLGFNESDIKFNFLLEFEIIGTLVIDQDARNYCYEKNNNIFVNNIGDIGRLNLRDEIIIKNEDLAILKPIKGASSITLDENLNIIDQTCSKRYLLDKYKEGLDLNPLIKKIDLDKHAFIFRSGLYIRIGNFNYKLFNYKNIDQTKM
jgi:hypothetical protein